MKLAVILPHTKLYGGVKRFFELGDVFIKKGHEFKVLTPDGTGPVWYSGTIPTLSLSSAKEEEFDAVFITETQFLEVLSHFKTRHQILYFVRPSDKLSILKKYPDVKVYANSTNALETAKSKYRIDAFPAFGGINTDTFLPKVLKSKDKSEPIVIMTYGRVVEKKKGTKLVVRACERLYRKGYNIKLLLFDTPVNEKAEKAIKKFNTIVPFDFVLNHPVSDNLQLYHKADIFVSAEKKAGHSNTSAEAMASGIPVIGTNSGTKDFLIHNETGLVISRWSRCIAKAIATLINDFELRQKLAIRGRSKIEEFSWSVLAEKILTELAK
ncbi:glycosyltransferase family 4 protein [Chryseosolibacter indicus]|uniref:Glycosyltransferase family 4 protein n=1 Tax=Chryseosolibacter indicus TaxID=2782351 RepID=A0ABS5VJL2_9BACT|nr:glycosyltransferase family 4 protein [Chryseosolibacter indicus]MBT1701652.1 glycosyltransferase family 4 protein [Chryseosolibacter indicus]